MTERQMSFSHGQEGNAMKKLLAHVIRASREWTRKHMHGHKSIGRWTFYGDNAMHFAGHVWTRRWGYVCWRPTTFWVDGDGRIRADRWYFYVSPNATPWAATYAAGPGFGRQTKREATGRRRRYGHAFDTRILHPDMYPEVLDLYPWLFEKS